MTCLEQYNVVLEQGSSMQSAEEAEMQNLYRCRGELEFIFRLIDTDGSGTLNRDEFCMAISTLNQVAGDQEKISQVWLLGGAGFSTTTNIVG